MPTYPRTGPVLAAKFPFWEDMGRVWGATSLDVNGRAGLSKPDGYMV